MQISSRFTIAVHMLACIDTFQGQFKITSEFLAGSIQVNPVIIRKLLSQLKTAGLIEVKRGPGGTYRAVDCVEENSLFHFHENPNPKCPVGRNIHFLLDDRLKKVQDVMEQELKSMTLADVKEALDARLLEEASGDTE